MEVCGDRLPLVESYHGPEEKLQRSGPAPVICLKLVLKLTIGQEVVRRIKSINLRKKSWDFTINM